MKNYPIEELTVSECNQIFERMSSRIKNHREQPISIIISNPDHKELVLVTVSTDSKRNRYKG